MFCNVPSGISVPIVFFFFVLVLSKKKTQKEREREILKYWIWGFQVLNINKKGKEEV